MKQWLLDLFDEKIKLHKVRKHGTDQTVLKRVKKFQEEKKWFHETFVKLNHKKELINTTISKDWIFTRITWLS